VRSSSSSKVFFFIASPHLRDAISPQSDDEGIILLVEKNDLTNLVMMKDEEVVL